MKLFTLLTFLLVSLESIGQADDTINRKEEEQVRKVLKDFVDAWNKHDVKAFAAIFTEDADFTNVRGKNARGRIEIEKHHEPGFKTKWASSYQKITQDKIRFIKPDVAAVDAWWELSGIKGPAGEDMPDRKGLLSFIMIRTGERWFIAVMHNMELLDSK